MARSSRRGRSGTTSPRTIVLLLLLVIITFAAGYGLLWGRSEAGLVARARLGLPVDRSMLARTISKTIRTTILQFGVPSGSQVIQTNASDDPGVPRVRWTAYLSGRSSTMQLNARLAENLARIHVDVIDGWEDTLATPGSEVHLLVGAGKLVTHELVLERRNDVVGAIENEPARLMLVVDAFGPSGNDSLSGEFLKLGVPISGAVLPRLKGTRDWAERLSRGGHDILVQIPLEPMNYPKRDPGPGAILVDMPAGQIQREVKKNLGDVPGAVGATSYMGQMALSDEAAMGAVMLELKRANVFYLDARPVPTSVAADRAARQGVLCFRIDSVLEAPGRYDAEVKAVTRLLDDAIDLARRRGYAIVLAHPDRASLDVLKRAVPKLKRSGVRFQPVSTLLTPQAD
ncbi:MAG: divergent polysaccharide deacetylase family protein [Candidatus Eisenbacteria bacterium]